MNKEFVPYEIALELEKIGFDEPFITFDTQYLYRNGDFCRSNSGAITMFKSFNNELVIAPLYQQAFRWFREKHNINGHFWDSSISSSGAWCFTVTKLEINMHRSSFICEKCRYKTPEEAELACLKKLIEIAKLK